MKSKYPVLVTTSRLLSTGVDTRTAAEFGAQLSNRQMGNTLDRMGYSSKGARRVYSRLV
jgi:hypothetical protein